MSRICALNPRLQLVEPTCEKEVPKLNWEGTISSDWRKLTWLSSVQESLPMLRYSEYSRIGVSSGSPSLNLLFSSSLVH